MSPVIGLGDGLAKATLRPFGVQITRSWLAAEESEVEEEAAGGGEARSDLTRRMADLLAGEVSEDRQDEVLQALRIDEIPTADIMIGTEEIIWLHLDDDLETHLRRIGEHGRVRYPVLRNGSSPGEVSVHDVRGFLYVPALFGADGWPREGSLDLPSLLAPPFHLPADLPVSRLIDRLQEESQELTLLTDPNDEDRVVGLVTVSDAFEVIAGDLQDPLDRRGAEDQGG
jgi:CBS domain containing-hemolysin-like protein